jgi:dTMP kinase
VYGLKRGFFLVLEGIDGSGKTTIAYEIKRKIEESNRLAIVTMEPSNNIIGEYLKKYLKETLKDNRDPVFETLAFATDRALHLKETIIPYIKEGYLVICDRYYYSSYVYQSIDGINTEWIMHVNRYMLKPDLAIFIDVNPETAIKRLGKPKNIFEKKKFLERVYSKYLELVDKGLLIKIDGDREIEKIVDDIIKIVFEKWK